MYRSICRSSLYFCSAIVAPNQARKLVDGNEETGWDRVVKIFKKDEYGDLSPQASQIYSTTLFSWIVGAGYGGFIHSRDTYMKFIESNEASTFLSHLDAKRKLQDIVAKGFIQGALKWSWRIALFGGMYTTISLASSEYHGEPSIIDFILGGTIGGGLYRINYGLNGVVAGATLGLFIGFTAGLLSMLILRLTGSSYDDIGEWHKEKLLSRKRNLTEALEKSVLQENKLAALAEHDKKINVP